MAAQHIDVSAEIAHLTMALQPVLDLKSGQVFGFEALLRGPAGTDIHPRQLLRQAKRERWLDSLEARAEALAFVAAERFLKDQEVLFINVESLIPSARERYPHTIVQIAEESLLHREWIERLRAAGLGLYIDNYGVDNGSVASILDIRPLGLTLDQSIVQGIAQDNRRFAIARTLNRLARDLGIDVVAKGIETSEDLCAARRAGFKFGQGYYLGRPVLEPSRFRLAATSRLLRGSVLEAVTSARSRAFPILPEGEPI
jgi:EAL domain-containing protein (putative c-di-GMP-specific phosphodiesterase class I)